MGTMQIARRFSHQEFAINTQVIPEDTHSLAGHEVHEHNLCYESGSEVARTNEANERWRLGSEILYITQRMNNVRFNYKNREGKEE